MPLRQLVEEVPEIPSQQRVEPDSRLVEDEEARPVEERRAERHAGPLAAGERPDDLVPLRDEPDALGDLVDAIGPDAQDPPEVREVLPHREVAVDGRVRRRTRCEDGEPGTCREPEDADLAAATIWTPTTDRISVDFPLPLGEEPRDAARLDVEGDPVQHLAAAALDAQARISIAALTGAGQPLQARSLDGSKRSSSGSRSPSTRQVVCRTRSRGRCRGRNSPRRPGPLEPGTGPTTGRKSRQRARRCRPAVVDPERPPHERRDELLERLLYEWRRDLLRSELLLQRDVAEAARYEAPSSAMPWSKP